MRFVIDCSTLLANAFPDESSEYAIHIGERICDGAIALAPGFARLEVANAMNVAIRRGRFPAEEIGLMLRAIEGYQIEWIDLAVFYHIQRLVACARMYELSAYDSCYLLLAMQEDIPLATLDKKLILAAEQAGVGAVTVQ